MVDYCAGAKLFGIVIFSMIIIILMALEGCFELMLELLVWKVPIAALMFRVFFNFVRAIENFDVCLGKVEDALLPRGQKFVRLCKEITGHRLVVRLYLSVVLIFYNTTKGCL